MDWFSWKNWKWSKTKKESTELKSLGVDSRVEQLQKENEKLRRTVDSLLANFGSNVQVGKNSLEGLTKDDMESLKTLCVSPKEKGKIRTGSTKTDGVSVELIEEGNLIRPTAPVSASVTTSTTFYTTTNTSTISSSASTTTPDSTSLTESKGIADIPVIDAGTKKTVFVKSAQKDEVAVVDMKNVEWWTIVNPDTLGADDDKDISYEDSELGDSFAVIQQDDVNESMASFLAVSIERHPDAKQLSPAELKKILDGTLAQAKKQGSLSQAYGWGMWLYSSYSWGSYIVRIYREPTLVKLVLQAACVLYNQPLLIPVFARGLWSAASWAVISYM